MAGEHRFLDAGILISAFISEDEEESKECDNLLKQTNVKTYVTPTCLGEYVKIMKIKSKETGDKDTFSNSLDYMRLYLEFLEIVTINIADIKTAIELKTENHLADIPELIALACTINNQRANVFITLDNDLYENDKFVNYVKRRYKTSIKTIKSKNSL